MYKWHFWLGFLKVGYLKTRNYWAFYEHHHRYLRIGRLELTYFKHAF